METVKNRSPEAKKDLYAKYYLHPELFKEEVHLNSHCADIFTHEFIPVIKIDSHLDLGSLLVIILGYCFLSFAAYLKKFCHGKPLDAILYIGRNTLPIYMFHPIFTMAGKYLQPIFRFDESGIAHAVTVILLGIGGSLLLAKALDQMHITWIFGRPRLLR
ncbi:MAG: hypothetical protein PUF32_00025 [Prevotella sp.]|nr:hypothetical protein [Prevotella sp.]